jgi:hypothetical protein
MAVSIADAEEQIPQASIPKLFSRLGIDGARFHIGSNSPSTSLSSASAEVRRQSLYNAQEQLPLLLHPIKNVKKGINENNVYNLKPILFLCTRRHDFSHCLISCFFRRRRIAIAFSNRQLSMQKLKLNKA